MRGIHSVLSPKPTQPGGVKPAVPELKCVNSQCVNSQTEGWPAIRSRHRHAVMPPDRGAVTYGLDARV
ncbi:hypothetical protein HaLaN_17484 [Haematococcus lacustris]|uniref:Uncharacterized protein n=1 Tax=Haematococcus lacustris TaxID=44745 RepID=A0A699ZES8_HAELA|nr:hypothetical protein HaLaN_17484 [Haematococcus lacustris]